MEAIFRLGAAVSAPSFPACPSGRRRAIRLQGAAVPVACALDAACLSRGAVATPSPWSAKPTKRSSTRTAAGAGDGRPGSIEQHHRRDKKDGGGQKDVEAEMQKNGEQQFPPPLLLTEALTAILPPEKRFQLLELLNQLALGQIKEAEVTKSPVSSKDWLSIDEKLAAGFALSLVYLQRKEYEKAKPVLEKLLKHEASSDASRVPFFMAALIATMLAMEKQLPEGKRS